MPRYHGKGCMAVAIENSGIPVYWEEAAAALSQADPVMAGIIASYRGEMLRGKGDAFHTLARSIVGQQISVKAADSVWTKLELRVASRESGGSKKGGREARAGALKEALLRMTEEELRVCGLSRSKATYLKSLAEFFAAENIAEDHWEGMEDEEVIRHITQIKGIGRWSAEMFLIFHLLRPDVFPVADLGLQKAIRLHYGDDRSSDDRITGKKTSGHPVIRSSDYRRLGVLWQPYRSVATWYLWRSLDPLPVEY